MSKRTLLFRKKILQLTSKHSKGHGSTADRWEKGKTTTDDAVQTITPKGASEKCQRRLNRARAGAEEILRRLKIA